MVFFWPPIVPKHAVASPRPDANNADNRPKGGETGSVRLGAQLCYDSALADIGQKRKCRLDFRMEIGPCAVGSLLSSWAVATLV